MYPTVPQILTFSGLCLGVTPMATAGVNDAGPPSAASSPDARSKRAYAAFEGQRHLEAALDFESLWREVREPQFLFNAAVSRFALRHQAHTVAYLEEYLALPELTADERGAANVQLEVARREATQATIELRVAGGSGDEIRLELERMPDAPSDLRPAILLSIKVAQGAALRAVYLDTGRWTIRGRCADGSSRSVELDVERTSRPRATLELACAQNSGQASGPERGQREAAITLAVVGGATMIVGGVVLGVFGGRKDELFGQASSVCGAANPGSLDYECHVRFARLDDQAAWGAGLLGVGGGLVLGDLAALAGEPSRRRKLQWAGVGVGAAVLVGGLFGDVAFTGPLNRLRNDEGKDWEVFQDDESVGGYLRGRTTMQGMLGLGTGLIVASGVGLLAEFVQVKRDRGAQTKVTVSPTLRGISLRLRF
jgi:hypothetical protein